MAERTGLEPATPGVTGRYSNQLNYRSGWGAALYRADAEVSIRATAQLARDRTGLNDRSMASDGRRTAAGVTGFSRNLLNNINLNRHDRTTLAPAGAFREDV